jgi:tight adherence protein C
MSSGLLLLLALAGTFGAITLAGLAAELSRAERARVMQLLETQVRPAPPDLRQQELGLPLTQRVVLPLISALGTLGRRLTPVDMRRKLARKLVLAGSPPRWDADRVAAMKIVGTVVGAGLGVVLAQRFDLAGLTHLGFIALLTGVGYFGPDVVLSRAVQRRQFAIRKALPDTMDLLTISVEAGLGFDAAMTQVVQNVPGPLSLEMARMLQEVQLGVSRADAFRHLAERTDVDEINAFVLAMIQADIFGISVSKVLRAQARELRTKRRQHAERLAMQIPVKILFPMILCVMPALFVVVIGPGVIRIFENFFGGF